MKTKIGIIACLFVILLSGSQGFAQKAKKTEEVKIKTSAVCGDCKERIEKNLAFTKGIKDVVLDLKTKIVTVKYSTAKTDPQKIKLAISKIGYDADEVLADPVAYDKLPACCKKDAPPH